MTRKTLYILVLISLTFLACSFAASLTPTATHPPQPTATETDIPTPTLDLTATAEVEATAEAAALLELIAPDLEIAGYPLDSGQLVWFQSDPVEIVANAPNSIFWREIQDPNPAYANFIMGVDIKWDSETGVAGCDIVYRAENDLRQGEKIVFETLRLSGYPGWEIALLRFNQYQGVLTGHVRANSAINLASGSTNHYVLIADGATTTAYANGTRLGTGTMPLNNVEGQIAFETWQESGLTTCTFSNAWIWELP